MNSSSAARGRPTVAATGNTTFSSSIFSNSTVSNTTSGNTTAGNTTATEVIVKITPSAVPTIFRVLNLTLSLVAISIVAGLFVRRLPKKWAWRQIGIGRLLLLIIYLDAWVAFGTTAMTRNALLANNFDQYCNIQFLFTLVFYLTMRMLVYFYFIERCFVIRRIDKPRWKSPLYLANLFGILGPYIVLFIFQFRYYSTYLFQGQCYMQRERAVLIPLVVFDIFVLIWLTGLFLFPLAKLKAMNVSSTASSYSDKTLRLRRFARRTFIGTCILLLAGAANGIAAVAFNKEPGWASMNASNLDTLCQIIVLHWMTTSDAGAEEPSAARMQLHNSDFKPPVAQVPQPQSHAQVAPWTAAEDPVRNHSFESMLVTTCSHDPHEPMPPPPSDPKKISVSTRHSTTSEAVPEFDAHDMALEAAPSVYMPHANGFEGEPTTPSSVGHRSRGSQSEPVDTLSFPSPTLQRGRSISSHYSDGKALSYTGAANQSSHAYNRSDEIEMAMRQYPPHDFGSRDPSPCSTGKSSEQRLLYDSNEMF